MAILDLRSKTRNSATIRMADLNYSTIYSNIYITVNGVRSSNLAQSFNTPYSLDYTFTGLQCGTNYSISWSILSVGGSQATGSGSFTTDTCPVVSNPPSNMGYIGVSASTVTEGKISATWSQVSGATWYVATIYNSGGGYVDSTVVYGTDVSFIVTPGNSYYIGVVPWNNDGKGGSNTSSTVLVPAFTARPSNWEWYSAKLTDFPTSLTTAKEWNDFLSRINEFRIYKKLGAYSFTTVYSGNPMQATQINEAASAIRGMLPPLPPFSNVVSGEIAYASILNRLRDSLNSIN